MNRQELEHVIRAAADVTNDEIVVIGSQSVLGEVREPPEALLESIEADMYPRNSPSRAIEIDGSLGDGSPFHEQFGYYGHGVGPETAVPPVGWEGRLKRVVFPPNHLWKKEAVAWFLDVHDLVLAKLAAGREKDFLFAEVAIRGDVVDVANLQRGLELMPESHRTIAAERLEIAIRKATEYRESVVEDGSEMSGPAQR